MANRSDIQKLEEQLKSVKTSSETICVGTKDLAAFGDDEFLPQVDTKILRYKCKLLEAMLNSFSEDTIEELPEDRELHKHMMMRDLLKTCKQHRESYAFLVSQKKKISEDIERRRQDREQLEAVVKAAEMKLNETMNEKFSKEVVVERLKAKCSAVDKLSKKCWEEMSTFLDKNYPLPSPETFDKAKSKMCVGVNSIYSQMKRQDLKPLKDIVHELMTSCIDNPNDPYITLDHRYWLPYIDLLLQCDIALRHPADSNRIKLMPFHL